MQMVQHGYVGLRALARVYGDSILVVAVILAAIAGAITLADLLTAAL